MIGLTDAYSGTSNILCYRELSFSLKKCELNDSNTFFSMFIPTKKIVLFGYVQRDKYIAAKKYFKKKNVFWFYDRMTKENIYE